jgi:hypothetical protein
MRSTTSAEQFVTLFDSSFLPQGLALAASISDHCPGAVLWVLAMNEEVERDLAALRLEHVKAIPLREIEDQRLRAAKADRTVREYCWTLVAFTFDAVFTRCPGAKRVTYVDADLFFVDSPRAIFDELEVSGSSILLTEHNFDPEYDKSDAVGRFCVQFLTMDRSDRAQEARTWWQARVLEWCHDRREPGRFGDQKYLDLWPELFGDSVHVLAQRSRALAPWNVRMEARKSRGVLSPTFYHFHSFRLVKPAKARAVEGGYAIPHAARWLYSRYAQAIHRAISDISAAGIEVPLLPVTHKSFAALRHLVKWVLGRSDVYVRIPRSV